MNNTHTVEVVCQILTIFQDKNFCRLHHKIPSEVNVSSVFQLKGFMNG